MSVEIKRYAPEALYSCANRQCAEGICYPANMMYWAVDEKGKGDWYCPECIENDPGLCKIEPDLEKWLFNQHLTEVDLAVGNYKERREHLEAERNRFKP